MPSQANISKVEAIKETLSTKKNFIVASYSGITVNEINALRNNLRQQGVEFRVMKNNLLGIALKESGYDESISTALKGPNVIAFAEEDLSAPAKLLKDYIKEKGDESPLEIKLGVADGVLYEKTEVEKIANLPSKEVLVAQIMSAINGPASGIAGVVSGVMSQLARAIQAVAEKNGEGK